MHDRPRERREDTIRRERPHDRRSSHPTLAAFAGALLVVLATACSPGGPDSAGEDVHASNPDEDAYAEPLTTEPEEGEEGP